MLGSVLCTLRSLIGRLTSYTEQVTSYYFGCDETIEEECCDLKIRDRSYIDNLYTPAYDKWLRSYGVVTSQEAYNNSCACEPYIYHGYRKNPSTIWSCIKSAFHPTNETFSFWTHFVPLILVLHRGYNFIITLEAPADTFYYPFYIYLLGSCYLLLASSLAHLLNPHSPRMQEFCFCADYAAIGVYGITSFITNQYYTCPHTCFASLVPGSSTLQYFIVCGLIASLIAPATCCSRLTRCPQRYLVRFMPTILCYLVAVFPCYTRIFLPRPPTSNEGCYLADEEFPSLFALHTIFYLMAAVVVLSRFPEKYFPGRFDIVGHSHHFFHIFTAGGMFFHQMLVEHAVKNAEVLREKGIPMVSTQEGYMKTIILASYVFISGNLVVYKFSKFLGKMVEHRTAKLHQS